MNLSELIFWFIMELNHYSIFHFGIGVYLYWTMASCYMQLLEIRYKKINSDLKIDDCNKIIS